MPETAASTKRPLLSIGLLNYNYGGYVAGCIESILKQSFTDFELTVIDDCSTDDSAAVIARYLGDERVKLVRHEVNRGFVESLIEVTEVHSRGKYVTVISADDFVKDVDAFRKQIALLESDEEIGFCFCGYDRIDSETGESTGVSVSFPSDRIFDGPEFSRLHLATIDIQILHSGAIMRASTYYACGGYRRDMSYCVDSALWFILPLYGKVAYSASVLYGYRVHRTQMSSSMKSVVPTTHETLAFIDSLFRVAGRKGIDVGWSRADVIRVYLPATAVAEAFGERRRECLLRLATIARVGGWPALSARRVWIAAARVTLGQRTFDTMKTAAGLLKRG